LSYTVPDIGPVNQLLSTMSQLLGPNGCPWDQKQTHKSLVPYLIEETHELIEAIENLHETDGTSESGNQEFIKELGDVLLQVVFHCEIARLNNQFDFGEVAKQLNEKLVSRHPHVFATKQTLNDVELRAQWEEIKAKESRDDSARSQQKQLLDSLRRIPKGLPALQVAQKIGEKSRLVNFDWSSSDAVVEKVKEELREVEEALFETRERQAEEIGDLLFCVSQLARHLEIDAETSLRNANRKFLKRFAKMDEICSEEKLDFKTLDNAKKEELWDKAKKLLRTGEVASSESTHSLQK